MSWAEDLIGELAYEARGKSTEGTGCRREFWRAEIKIITVGKG